MNNQTSLSERLQRAFQPTARAVVGLVDDLLSLSREQQLHLDWHANVCRIRPLGNEAQQSINVPVQKSVFRAMLARVAALCNERTPDVVSPYGGEAELPDNAKPPAVFRVSFTNTPAERRLEVRYLEPDTNGTRKFTVLLRARRIVTVHGHALKYVQNVSNPSDYGSYGVLLRTGGAEVLVALFRVSEVTGIFSGDLEASRESA